jgi:hypothetical protein
MREKIISCRHTTLRNVYFQGRQQVVVIPGVVSICIYPEPIKCDLVHVRVALILYESHHPNTLVFFDCRKLCQALCYV